ncbi:hypothetical protein Z043_107757, partial [Scleropages formosus]
EGAICSLTWLAAPKSPGERTRYDTSLGLLTRKFMGLLKESADGVLDLNRAAEVLDDQTVIAVKAPLETKLEVPDISGESLQIYLKSTKGPIEVYLCPEEGLEDGSPLKSCVPPPAQKEEVKEEAPTPQLDVEGILGLPPGLLQITEDQLPSSSSDANQFVSFSPPLEHEDYLWGLDDGEGVSDLFDNYDLGDLLRG